MATAAEEAACFEQLWALAPTVNGFLAGAPAVKFLSSSGLPTSMLRQIWSMCDKTTPWGKLQKREFFNACKLVAVAQSGAVVEEAGLKTKTPLPDLKLPSSGEPEYPEFSAAAIGHQQDDWDEIGCDLNCAVESRYVDDLKACLEQAKGAQIPRHYAFPDEDDDSKLVDTVIKLLAELDPQQAAGGAGGAAGGVTMPVDVARRFLGRKGKNMSDADIAGLLELAQENHLDLKDLSIRRLLIMRYNAKKIRAGWAAKNMPRLGGDDDQGAAGHAAEMALAFAATARAADEAAAAAAEAIAASKARLDKLLADGNAQVDKAKEDGDSDMADALRASMDLEVEFHRQQQATWEQWQQQQEQAASEAKAKASSSTAAGGGKGGGGGAAAAPAATKPSRQETCIDDECPICFEEFEDASKTPCKHVFCKECIVDWLSHTASCPLCRADMTAAQLVNL